MFAQDAAFYRRARVDETDDAEALRRLKELEAVDRMREHFTLSEALSAPGGAVGGEGAGYFRNGFSHTETKRAQRF